MDSVYENGTFVPSLKFGLSDFKDDSELSIENIIEQAYDKLSHICKAINTDYKCVAFRAGGYNVEPESKRILNKLHELGIRIESSVIQGLYQNFSFSKIDYRQAPNLNKWNISKNGPLIKVDENSGFVEYPITSMPISPVFILKRRLNKLLNKKEIINRNYKNTGKAFSAISTKSSLIDKLRMAFNPISLSFDRDYMTLELLEDIVNHNIRKFRDEKEIVLTLISHPKAMGKFHLDLMEQFVLKMKEK